MNLASISPAPEPTPFDADWNDLPGLVDGVVAPEAERNLASAARLERISELHPDWVEPFQATLVCVALLRRGTCRELLLRTLTRLELTAARQRQVALALS